MNNELNLETKQCHTCKEIKPYENFCRNKRRKDGYHTECKACVKIYQLKNKERVKEYQKPYQIKYKAENKEELAKYLKQYHKDNPEKHKTHQRNWYNKEKNKLNKQAYNRFRNQQIKAKTWVFKDAKNE